MMIVVSNTSPLIALAKTNQFTIFQQLFQKVLIPKTVSEEFLQNCTSIEKTHFQSACEDCIEIVEVKTLFQAFSRRLDRGEQEALTLAIQKSADILIIDDRKAFNEACDQNIIAVSTRAILKMATEKEIIKDYQALEAALKKESFFLPNY